MGSVGLVSAAAPVGAWPPPPAAPAAMASMIPLKLHPKRVEGVFVSAQSRYGELLLTKTFNRDTNDKPVLDGEIRSRRPGPTHPSRSTGNFANLFASSPVASSPAH